MTMTEGWYWQDLETIGSTNDYAAEQSFTPPAEKFVISAAEQTKGRGRRGRSWLGFAGNLFMSLALKGELKDINFLPFISSLALLQSIKALKPDLEVTLKWPNDVLVQGAKVSGILLEKPENEYIIIGIGVNIKASPDKGTELLYSAISLDECKIDIDRCSFLKLYLQRFNEIYAAYSEHGFGIVREQWLQNADHLGGEIKVNMENTAEDGIFRGLDNNGALLLEQQGKIRKIYAGDVFIKRK